MINAKSICVYCGSSPGTDPSMLQAATDLGAAIARAGYGLVYGGGTKGLMGAVANGALARGGTVTGIIPEFLMEKEATREALGTLTELVVTADMHERKHTMFERSDAFVTLPGGIGTLEEVIEIMTWAQLGRHEKPIVLANFKGFWDPLTALLDHMTASGFIHTAHRVKPLIVDTSGEIVPAIAKVWNIRQPEGDPSIIEKL